MDGEGGCVVSGRGGKIMGLRWGVGKVEGDEVEVTLAQSAERRSHKQKDKKQS